MDKNFWRNENKSDDNKNEPEILNQEAEVAGQENETVKAVEKDNPAIIPENENEPAEEELKANPSHREIYSWISSRESHTESEEKKNPPEYRWNYNDYKNEKKAEKKVKTKSSAGLKVFAAAMSVFFFFTAVTATLLLIQNNSLLNSLEADSTAPIISNVKSTSSNGDSASLDLNQGENSDKVLSTEDVIEKVKPSVVCIEVEATATVYGRSYKTGGTGTGFILTADGYIATNNHVVEGAEKIKVTLTSGEVYDAVLIGGDSTHDLAVIKIDAKNLPAAELGDSDALREGEDVVAIGSPGGIEFAGSNTKGIISALNREIEVDSDKNYTTRKMKVIQTDASINPGNSGGPLVNNKGHVIGINTMKIVMSEYEGMGFAIPINGAIPIIQALIDNKDISGLEGDSFVTDVVDTVKIGITGGEISAAAAAESGIPQGIQITEIEAGGPCDGKGIGVGDIIVGYNGKTVETFNDIKSYKSGSKPGDKATLTIYRNGTTFDVEIILAEAVATEKQPSTAESEIPGFIIP